MTLERPASSPPRRRAPTGPGAVLLAVAFLLAGGAARPASTAAAAAAVPGAFRIWPGTAPGSDASHWPSRDYHEEWERPGEILRGVTEPTLEAFLPEAAQSTRAAVVLCPGGGYQNLWIAKEGFRIADELRRRGVAGIVLKYRHYDRYAAVDDAQRAVRLVRSRASEWGLDPAAIGIGGFSAGGHLALHMAAQQQRRESWALDAVDRLSKRPDFVLAVYPSVQMPADAVVDATFPPTFIAVAADDTKMMGPILPFFSRLLELHVPAELHVYQGGGHGFGAGTKECGCASWLDLFRAWLDQRGLLHRRGAAGR